MRSISRLRAVATAVALIIPASVSVAVAGGFGGGHMGAAPAPMARPGIGVGAYAPGEGAVGASGWNGGNWRGYTPAFGTFWGGGYSGGGEGGGGEAILRGGSTNVITYNHYDQRRRDGGFYGGNGVFYGDNGYSRLTPPPSPGKCEGADPRADGNPHIIHLSESAYPHRRPARR